MSNEELEFEIQERVKFKLNDIKDSIKNAANRHWSFAVVSGDEKQIHYWQAFEKLEEIFDKETRMPVPFDNVLETRRRERKDIAVREIEELFMKAGRDRITNFNYGQKIRNIVSIIEEAQRND